jgi:hypothetical protein
MLNLQPLLLTLPGAALWSSTCVVANDSNHWAFQSLRGAAPLAKVVDRLLRSPQFGERWGRHWLDVVRYADSVGKSWNAPFTYA